MAEDRFDGMFLTIAQQAQGIEPLLDTMFSFLRRKTDFFAGASQEKIEELLLTTMRKHSSIAEKEQSEKKIAAAKEDKKRKDRLEAKRREEEKAAASVKANIAAEHDDVIELSSDGSFDTSSLPSAPAIVTPPTPPLVAAAKADDSTPTLPTEEAEDNTPAPLGNGGTTDKYSWTQTLADLSVVVPLPAGTKAKLLNVEIKNTHIKVGVKGQPLLFDGELHKRVVVDDSFWTVEDGDLVINLQKDNKMEWWKCVMTGDAEINTQKVQPENSKLSDLDGETRQTVEKMMFDQRQKAQGLPSSEELQKQEMLKKFMSAHPEMDFSQAKFT